LNASRARQEECCRDRHLVKIVVSIYRPPVDAPTNHEEMVERPNGESDSKLVVTGAKHGRIAVVQKRHHVIQNGVGKIENRHGGFSMWFLKV
jgi:hypothetical protein